MTSKRHNTGAAVLIFLAIVLLAVSTLLVSEVSVNGLKDQRNSSATATLNQAKQSLIGYALEHAVPGTLPCPDSTGDGLENPAVGGCQTQLGLLPSRTLNLADTNDPSGADIWYAVDLNYTNNAIGFKNSSLNTTLTVDALPRAAVVIAPGKSIDSQSRRTLNVADHLEGVNADGNTLSYTTQVSELQNDRLLAIEPGPYWSIVEARVLAETANLLNQYRTQCGEYPFAANFGGPFGSINNQQIGAVPFATALPTDWGAICGAGTAPTPPTWLSVHWSTHLLYRMCQSGEGNCVTVLNSENSPAAGVLIAPGVALAGQARPDIDTADYFEGENVGLPDNEFRRTIPLNHTDTANDMSHDLVP